MRRNAQRLWRVTRHPIGLAAALIILLVGASIVANSARAQTDLPVPSDVVLRVGDTTSLDGGALQVTLVRVEEDSRCPMDALCVWTGRAVVRLRATVDGVDRGEVATSLFPGPQDQRSPTLDAVIDRYVLSLVDLQPYPRASQPQPLDQRAATIRVGLATP